MRRLSAILAADVVGYSVLVREDEDGTLSELKAIRGEILERKIQEHNGRIVKLMGDGLLAEFTSVVSAVECALEVQLKLQQRLLENESKPLVRFRIGINLGDVVFEDGDIFGNGVNLAARLEEHSEPGSICVSNAVFEQVRDRLDVKFDDLGEIALKNFDEPVRVWQWCPPGTENNTPEAGFRRSSLRYSKSLGETGNGELMSRPAVLFLPFEVLGAIQGDWAIALGLCEDIRTNLSSWRSFPVIGAEALGGKTGDLQSLADSVDASYVVTGSLRRSGNRARVSVRLIDASSGSEIWNKSFDGTVEDMLDFQDDVSQRVVSQIEPEIAHAAASRVPVIRAKGFASWELVAKSIEEERKGGDGYGTKHANIAQRELLLEALKIEPDFAEAWARLARTYFRDFLIGWSDDPSNALRLALEASTRAVELDPENSLARAYHAQCLLFGKYDPEAALEHAQEAVRLNPSNVVGHVMMGCVLVYLGQPETAFSHYEIALRLNPNFPNMGTVVCDQMMCRAMQGDLSQAVALARKMISIAPKYFRGLQRCAAVLAHAGRLNEAGEVLRNAEEIGGSFSEKYIRETYPFTDERHLELLILGLRKAGWKG